MTRDGAADACRGTALTTNYFLCFVFFVPVQLFFTIELIVKNDQSLFGHADETVPPRLCASLPLSK